MYIGKSAARVTRTARSTILCSLGEFFFYTTVKIPHSGSTETKFMAVDICSIFKHLAAGVSCVIPSVT